MNQKNVPHENGTQPNRQLMTQKEVAELLQVSDRHISNMSKRGEIPPPIKIGRSVRFRPQDIDQWIDGKWERRNNPGGPNLAG